MTGVPTTGVPAAGEPTAPGPPPAPAGQGDGFGPGAGGVTPRPARFTDVVRSEWTKLRSVRSTWITLAVIVVVSVGIGALIGFGVGSHFHRAEGVERFSFDPVATGFGGLVLSELAVGVLGVLVISNEYTTGMIRTTFQAAPRRGQVLAAKALVFTAVILVLGEVLSFATFFVSQAMLKAGPAPYATIGGHIVGGYDPGSAGVLRAVIGGGLYLAAIGLLALAIGSLIRHTAGGVAAFVGLVFVIPIVGEALPDSWRKPIEEYLPTSIGGQGAGPQILTVNRIPNVRGLDLTPHLAPWPGFALLCGYTAVALAAAYILLKRRDA